MKLMKWAVFAAALLFGPTLAMAQTQVRIMWYSDGNEGDVMQDLLNRFQQQNPDIKINFDKVPYNTILQNLPQLLASGQGPDIARVTDLGGLSQNFLDISPYIKDQQYWNDNFAGVLPWVRPDGKTTGIYGLMTQLTLTLPFVNATLFEQAGIPLPGPNATWKDWAVAANAVAKKVGAPYPIAVDRSGHRVGAIAISDGAKIFNGDSPALIDDGFKSTMQMIYDWHQNGTMSKALWGSVGGTTYEGANQEFSNGQVVLYYSGTWQIPQFTTSIGNNFDWYAVPNPCGAGGCTGMPGGAALVPIKTTKSPEAVARILDWLASEPIYSEYHARTFFLPASTGLAVKGVPYKSDLAQVNKSLATAVGEVAKTSPIAYKYQGYASNRIMFNATISRLNQAISGEMTLDQAYQRMQQDIVDGLAAKGIKLP